MQVIFFGYNFCDSDAFYSDFSFLHFVGIIFSKRKFFQIYVKQRLKIMPVYTVKLLNGWLIAD